MSALACYRRRRLKGQVDDLDGERRHGVGSNDCREWGRWILWGVSPLERRSSSLRQTLHHAAISAWPLCAPLIPVKLSDSGWSILDAFTSFRCSTFSFELTVEE